MHKIVHLDLKGAPLKVNFLEKVLLCIKQWGATGILLEWEDTFPYAGELFDIGSQANSGGDGMYSVEEVQYIMQFTKQCGLEPIQLVQTIGHMEFVLKHPAFRGLREASNSPAVLCPSKPDSQRLVRMMLEQALDVQPDAVYFHIGADEVWHTGICEQCQQRAAASDFKAASLYLDHIRDLALFLKQKRPNLTILMWDDMLRSISLDILRVYQLWELVEPVVWHYNPKESFQIDPNLWDTYRQLFPKVWAGSAFKGASGSCEIWYSCHNYWSNNVCWFQEVNKYGSVINFAGVILTGWSRYDHYASLCEMLPVALPSLASCLRAWTGDDKNRSDILPPEQWPGKHVAQNVYTLRTLRNRCSSFLNEDRITTWMNSWQLKNNYVNPIQIQCIIANAQQLILNMTYTQKELSTHLPTITGRRSTEEFIETYISPLLKKITKIRDTAEARCKMDAGVRPEQIT